jgi:hypothetical protein
MKVICVQGLADYRLGVRYNDGNNKMFGIEIKQVNILTSCF